MVKEESVICPGCGCLCDDLDVTLEGGRIVEVANVCIWGASRFLQSKKFHSQQERRRLSEPQVRRRGRLQSVPYETALEEAAQILLQARRPVIYGLTNLGCLAQERTLKLAQDLGARLEPADLALMAPYYQSLVRYPIYWGSLETVRDEADAILFWGANPLHSGPRHLVRYSVFARGRYAERGPEDRRVAVVDIHRTEMAALCQEFIQIEPGQELSLIKEVAASLKGAAWDAKPRRGAKKLVEFFSRATFGVIFCGRGISYGPAAALYDEIMALASWLNQEKPVLVLPMSGDFNSAGLYHLLLRELGSPGAPDFTGGGVKSHFTPCDFRQTDAVLMAGGDLCWFLPEEEKLSLQERQVPIIALSPYANRTTAQAQVVLPVALAGVESEEIAYRMDGLPVTLRALVSAAAPPDHQVLADLDLFT